MATKNIKFSLPDNEHKYHELQLVENVDQNYNANSSNPQSGIAINQAFSMNFPYKIVENKINRDVVIGENGDVFKFNTELSTDEVISILSNLPGSAYYEFGYYFINTSEHSLVLENYTLKASSELTGALRAEYRIVEYYGKSGQNVLFDANGWNDEFVSRGGVVSFIGETIIPSRNGYLHNRLFEDLFTYGSPTFDIIDSNNNNSQLLNATEIEDTNDEYSQIKMPIRPFGYGEVYEFNTKLSNPEVNEIIERAIGEDSVYNVVSSSDTGWTICFIKESDVASDEWIYCIILKFAPTGDSDQIVIYQSKDISEQGWDGWNSEVLEHPQFSMLGEELLPIIDNDCVGIRNDFITDLVYSIVPKKDLVVTSNSGVNYSLVENIKTKGKVLTSTVNGNNWSNVPNISKRILYESTDDYTEQCNNAYEIMAQSSINLVEGSVYNVTIDGILYEGLIAFSVPEVEDSPICLGGNMTQDYYDFSDYSFNIEAYPGGGAAYINFESSGTHSVKIETANKLFDVDNIAVGYDLPDGTKVKISSDYLDDKAILPSQEGKSNKFLCTNGINAVWTDIKINNSAVATITIENGQLDYIINHPLNTRDVMVQIYDLDDYSTMITDVYRISDNSIKVQFDEQLTTGKQFRVMIISMTGNCEPKFNYLCFTAEEDNSTISMGYPETTDIVSFEYSFDQLEWNEFIPDEETTVTLQNVGDKAYFRGINNIINATFIMTGKIAASGSVMSLIDGSGLSTDLSGRENCFDSLFYECESLTTPPELPATTLSNRCYSSMFQGCTSLTTPPELPATTLAENCYESMFNGCILLGIAEERDAIYSIEWRIPENGIASGDYTMHSMFYRCPGIRSTNSPNFNGIQKIYYLDNGGPR